MTDTGIYPGEIQKEDIVIRNTRNIQTCTGCHECWTKTPGRCVLKDPLEKIGYLLSRCDELLIVSRCLYGGFSTFVQRVIERMMPYLTPFYQSGYAMHHKCRYHNSFRISACFYGENLSDPERKEAIRAVDCLADEFCAEPGEITFVNDALAVGGLS